MVYDDGSGNPSGTATSTSAANGRFYVYGIPAPPDVNNAAATKVNVSVTAAPGYDFSGVNRDYHVLNSKLPKGDLFLNQNFPPTMFNISGSVSNRYNLPLSGAQWRPIPIAILEHVLHPAVTDNNGNFSLQVPSDVPFALEFLANNYRSAYSQDFQISQPTSLGDWPLLSSGDYSLLGWPLTSGTTFIRGLTLDILERPVAGVSLTVTNPPGTYTVEYVSAVDNKTLGGSATSTNGLFVVPGVTPTGNVTLSASNFFPVSFSHLVADTDSLGGALDFSTPGLLTANPTSVNFGSVNFGGGPFTQTITLTNNGLGDITISSYNMSGNSGDFSIVPGGPSPCPGFPGTVAPGVCTLQVTFSPAIVGPRAATLNIISNASSGTNYTIQLFGNALAVAPNAPTNVIVNPWDGQATVNFNPPAFDGGSPITGYIITVNPGNMTFPTSNTSFTVNGLTNGIGYAFWVKATNSAGTGPDSSPAVIATPYFAPIRTNDAGYGDLESAVSAVSTNGTITAQNATATVRTPPTAAPLTLTKGLTLSGGWNTTYSAETGYTTIPVRVDIKGSTFKVIFKNVKIKAP